MTNNALTCSIDFIQLARVIIYYSGRGVLHKGHYWDCLENERMKYAIIQLGMGVQDLGASVGLCLPRSCSDNLIVTTINQALKIVGTPLNILSINSETENYNYPLFWLSYIFVIFTITLLVLTFIATIRNSNSQQSNKYLNNFNLVSNMKHFHVRKGQPLNLLDGVRALAMMWVVLGHVYLFWLQSKVENSANMLTIAKKSFFLIIQAGIISVDVFLCLGGFFLAFIMLRSRVSVWLCLMGIVQRALRVWPAYIFSMIFFYTFYMLTGSGPNWFAQEPMIAYCQGMWKDIFFVANYTSRNSSMCLSWGWYLQVDFQLFILGVIILYIYSFRSTITHILIVILSALSSIYVFVYVILNNVVVYTDVDQLANIGKEWYWDVYTSAYGRCVPYLMSLSFGIVYMEYRKGQKQNKEKQTILGKIRMALIKSRTSRIILEWTGVGLMALVTFVPRPLQTGSSWPIAVHALYWILSKPLFILGMILTILPSTLGISHSFFNLILNARILIIIARISFCTYLVHLMLVFRFSYNRAYDVYYHLTDTFTVYMGLLVVSLFIGFWMTMLVEIPFANLLKMSFEKVKNSDQQIQKTILKDSLLTNEPECIVNHIEPNKL